MKLFRFLVFSILGGVFSSVYATPSSIFWTNCTTDTTPKDKVNIQLDNYFTVFRGTTGTQQPDAFFPDIGIEGGFTLLGFNAEAGLDFIGGLSDPLFFNGKIAVTEGHFFNGSPSCSLGIFGVGTRPRMTNLNIVDIVFGKTLPPFIGGRIFWGGFRGNRVMGSDQAGFWVAYSRSFCKAKDCKDIDYFRWTFLADYASGRNMIGGGGFGLQYNFSSDLNIITGPVWFNDAHLNGTWKWTVQVNIFATAPWAGKKWKWSCGEPTAPEK